MLPMRLKKHNHTLFLSAWHLLLGLTIVFNLASKSIHELTAHTDHLQIFCTSENEKDACHRYVYHHEESRQCHGGHQHILSLEKDCFACHYYKQRAADLFSESTSTMLSHSSTYNVYTSPQADPLCAPVHS